MIRLGNQNMKYKSTALELSLLPLMDSNEYYLLNLTFLQEKKNTLIFYIVLMVSVSVNDMSTIRIIVGNTEFEQSLFEWLLTKERELEFLGPMGNIIY